ncbi:hypothetical protein Calla_1687 [Caldicellulosiruptor acetigenus 6A]|uniref:Uncharacterized protein n=1 Tax=Caldicellulosiruptor acetigenus 6A TaxID=632516 RepID=G2PTJ9_9FIRM|nr:hypothetical protein Calla_1687 [Caldicellulosiruptor acetigenus 6A]
MTSIIWQFLSGIKKETQNIILLTLKIKKEDWLTKDFSEQFLIYWINNNILLIYNIPRKTN